MARSRTLVLAFLLAASMLSAANAQWYQGPTGGTGGQAFDDWVANGKATNIRMVLIVTSKTDKSIHCIETFYPNPDAPNDPTQSSGTASSSTGCPNGSPSELILELKLDPDEYILGISGQYSDHVSSLRFFTNKKNSPVYGEGGGREFGYTAPRGQMIVAFSGAGDTRLRSIGVMYAPCTPATKACK